ncbi:MAG: NRDE family protein [Thiohalocapsa sp.]
MILRRPGHDWPVLLAANRDELRARPSRPPGRHWPDWPEVVGGLDCDGGGSWLAVNDHGVLAAVLNREGTLGPEVGKRSRGELVLQALDHAEAGAAAGALADLNPDAYRPFNLLIADPRATYWLRHGGDGAIRVHPVPPGLHMLTAAELDDPGQPRIARFLPEFRAAAEPSPALGDWGDWVALLGQRSSSSGDDREAAMNLDGIRVNGRELGTVASSLIALPAYPAPDRRPIFLHADGPPDRAVLRPVDLGNRT